MYPDKQRLASLIREAASSGDADKAYVAWVQVQLYDALRRLERPADSPDGDAMSWYKVAAIIGGILVPVVGVFAWGHSDISRDINRLDRSVSEVRSDISGFKDQTYERFADIQKQISDTRSDVSNYRAELIPFKHESEDRP